MPANFIGNQSAHNGNGYMGTALYYATNPGFREYIVMSFTTPLLAGRTYELSWQISLADNSQYASDDLQFYFSASAPTWGGGNWQPMTIYTPQAEIPTGTIISNKSAWTNYTVPYTASGGERYLTMGNFKTDANTTLVSAPGGTISVAYLYFDSGSLIEIGILPAELTNLTAQVAGPAVNLNWVTHDESATDHFEVQRSVGDYLNWETLGTLPAAGESAGQTAYAFQDGNPAMDEANFYRIKLIDLNGSAHYTDAVEATPVSGHQLVALHPNPVSRGQEVNLNYLMPESGPIEVNLTDLNGKQVQRYSFSGIAGRNALHLPTHDLAPGYYLLKASSAGKTTVERLVVR